MPKKNTHIDDLKGIRISVKSKFKKPFLKKNKPFYIFRSSIVVHNFSKSNIHILSNYKCILRKKIITDPYVVITLNILKF